MMRGAVACALLGVLCAAWSGAAPVVLGEGGEARCCIVLPGEPDENETLACEELARYLGKIIGVAPEVSRGKAAEGFARISVGVAGEGALPAEVSSSPEGFAIQAKGRGIEILGTTSAGALHGAYAFLDHLGCRWFMPGEIGEVIPRDPDLRVAPFELADAPDFEGRQLCTDQTWERRNKLGGEYFMGSHAWAGLLPPKQHFEEHPEYFSLVDGERTPRQLCTSNPEVIRLVAEAIKGKLRSKPGSRWVGIGPNDGGGFCECAGCLALDAGDWDPYSAEVSITDRFLEFANAVAEQVVPEFPDVKLGYYIYHTYMRPPLRVKAHPNISGALAPIGLCRVHGLENPVCPERNYWGWLIREWPGMLSEVYHRGYSYNLAGPQVPISLVSVWREDVPACKRAGIVGFRVETQVSWPSHMPTPYVMAKLFWDADADVAAVLEDYFSKFFGPAAAPMKAYWTTLDDALYRADSHTGNGFNVPDWYPPDVMARLERHLRQAERAAKHEPYRERVRIFARSFEYLQSFQTLLAADGRHDFTRAAGAFDEMQAIVDEFMAYDPPLFGKYTAPRLLPRFWKAAVYEGKERTTGGNHLAARFGDEWEFLLDPDGVGEEQGLYRPDVEGGNWTRLKTHSASWSDQGLRYYKGQAWYRQTVTVPRELRGRRLRLWFGAVDERAKVWVNGRLVGETKHDAWSPFEFDVTGSVRCGRPATVVVKVTNEVVDELGTGGIMRPVMIWAEK